MKYALPALFVAALMVSGASADDHGATLSVDGLGPLKFGMATDQVLRILQHEAPYNPNASDSCAQFTTAQMEPLGVSFVVERHKLIRIDVQFGSAGMSERTYKTDRGIGLGSAEEDVLKAYPAAVIKHNPADPSWHTIVFAATDRSRGLIFETNGKTVKSMRAGETAAITLPEECN